MSDFPTLTLLAAFTAGTISFLSPCVLPLVPGYISFIVGRTPSKFPSNRLQEALRSLSVSLFFVIGFTIVFMLMGAAFSIIGQWIVRQRYILNIVGGSIVIVFGLYMTGILKSFWLSTDTRFRPRVEWGGHFSALVLGMAFAFGWTPCIGPILGTILTLTAVNATAGEGIIFLGAYSMGLGIPFLLAAVLTEQLMVRIRTFQRISRPLHIAAGILLILMGVAMITGYLSRFGVWLLNTNPWLLNLGQF